MDYKTFINNFSPKIMIFGSYKYLTLRSI
jgi:hypothetical protein